MVEYVIGCGVEYMSLFFNMGHSDTGSVGPDADLRSLKYRSWVM